MIDRYLLILLSVLVLGTVGAFFLLAPILPTLVVSVMLIGMVATFWLGLYVGKPQVEASDSDQNRGSDSGDENWTLSEHTR
jgi:hypothetical protein